MKICPRCQESNHDAADFCMLCGAALPALPQQPLAADPGQALLLPSEPPAPQQGLALAVYHDHEPRIVAYLPLRGQINLLGREDASQNLYPELDLTRIRQPGVSIEHASRRHAQLLLRPGGLALRTMPETTGTQLNRDLIPDGQEVPLHPGDRLILGGKVRLKLMSF